jgi:DNA polymerase I-like protein with 3'-5' exonuclease and polymerase domains
MGEEMRRLCIDIETDGLLFEATRIHCLVLKDLDTGEVFTWQGHEADPVLGILNQANVLYGHGIIDFDIPVLRKFGLLRPDHPKVIDTLVWSRLAFPTVDGHGLGAWGQRLGLPKLAQPSWETWTHEMQVYCQRDVEITCKLVDTLEKQAVSQRALDLELEVAWVIAEQYQRGFRFDEAAAQNLHAELLAEYQVLSEELKALFPVRCMPNGEHVAKVNRPKLGITKGSTYTKIKLEDFNPNSRPHIEYWLRKKYGWEPRKFTPTGQALLDESVLGDLEYPEATRLAYAFLVGKRLAMLADGEQSWISHVRHGRIHGRVNTCGAITGRMTHYDPNMAQVPSNRKPFGEACRKLFIASPGYDLVGVDASSLELRCLAHYLSAYDKGKYAEQITTGDIHEYHRSLLGLETRDQAKTLIYAFIYGAGATRIGQVVGGSMAKGRELKDLLLLRIPAFSSLLYDINRAVESRGCLKGLDGRKLAVRSQHSALNTLIQSAGAVVMKQALVICQDKLHQNWGGFVANIHDEWQMEVRSELAESVGKIAQESIVEAGRVLDLRCPMAAGEVKIGKNWSQTH